MEGVACLGELFSINVSYSWVVLAILSSINHAILLAVKRHALIICKLVYVFYDSLYFSAALAGIRQGRVKL